ncbi:hypothetical protein V6N13_054996 [Hibiscus sabdariffa]|uniref:GRF-type domain-containing protein n=1 Tax=Hibiscus sabdariffa TaxID=183260 RepID=A0ABR2DXW3_9ROSI
MKIAPSSCASSGSGRKKLGSGSSCEHNGEEIKCYCGDKCPMWTTWKNTENLGRRLIGCPNYKTKPCGFLKWIDEPMSKRARFLINKLKMRNDELHKLNANNEVDAIRELKTEMKEMQK